MIKTASKDEKHRDEPERARRPLRILIADDDEEMADLLVDALQKVGYETVTCLNGWQLLQHLKFAAAGDPRQSFDLVISDIRMPHVSGLDVLRAQNFGGQFPPIILITGFGDEWTRDKARYLGAVDVFDKPFDIGDLVKRVNELTSPEKKS